MGKNNIVKFKINENTKNIIIKIIQGLLIFFIVFILPMYISNLFVDDYNKYCGTKCLDYNIGYDDAGEGDFNSNYSGNKLNYKIGFEQGEKKINYNNYFLSLFFWLIVLHYFGKTYLEIDKEKSLYKEIFLRIRKSYKAKKIRLIVLIIFIIYTYIYLW